MKGIFKLHILFVFLSVIGCKEATNNKENSKEGTLKVQQTYEEPEFVIDGVYGTSTALPLLKNHAVNVLDGNTTTSWKTIKGAGPKEGIMVYFNKPVFIKKINIIQAEGTRITKVNQFDVYANGKVFNTEKINSSVEALFIRIKEVNIENVITNTFIARGEGVYGDVKGSNTIFSPNQSVAISEIEFIDSSGNKIDFVIPKLVKASIKSSSTLTPEVAYTAANLFDCKKDFGWAENVAGNGIGESITIKTATSIEYNKVKIWNGYQRSSQHFNANGSVKELYITNNLNKENQLEKSNQDQVIALRNIKSPQVFSINERKLTDAFKFTLKDIYQGDRYEDVLMSEIRLYEKNVPVILLSDEAERIVESNIKEKTSHKVLASILDRNMSVRFQEREEIEDTFFNKNKEISFTLRSNNSFVMYKTESQRYDGQEADFNSQTIADGNWELISKNEEEVKVRVFGRIYDVYDGVEAYKGKGKKESVKIFKDVVTLTMNTIEGEKFIDKIQLR